MILQLPKARHSHRQITTNSIRFLLITVHLIYRCRYLALPFEALSFCCGSQGRMTGKLVDLTCPVYAFTRHLPTFQASARLRLEAGAVRRRYHVEPRNAFCKIVCNFGDNASWSRPARK